jgi:hypothetical protein
MKICTKCHQEKPIKEFHHDRKTKDGFFSWCKTCKAIAKETYRLLHKEDYNRRNREYRRRHPERIYQIKRASYLANREYYATQTKEYSKMRWRTDAWWRLCKNLKERLRLALRGAVKAGRTKDLLGIDREGFKKHIESLFKSGMSWDNYGQWHIDHIRPCASFDLTDPEQQRQCFHYTNLQPLWAIENARKGTRILKVA